MSVKQANPCYDTYEWSISPNGALYVLIQGALDVPPRPQRLGRVVNVKYQGKYGVATGSQVPVYVLTVDVPPEAALSSAEVVQSPTLPIQRHYLLQEALFSDLKHVLPGFKCHEEAKAAHAKFKSAPDHKDVKKGKWMRDFVAKSVKGVPPSSIRSNPEQVQRTLDNDFSAAASGTTPSVFQAGAGVEPPPRFPPAALNSERNVAEVAGSQPMSGEQARARWSTWCLHDMNFFFP